MKPCLSVRYLMRLAVWEARALLCISRALRWKAEWPELHRDYLRDARTWGRLLNCSMSAFVEHGAATCVWLTKHNQSALEVCA